MLIIVIAGGERSARELPSAVQCCQPEEVTREWPATVKVNVPPEMDKKWTIVKKFAPTLMTLWMGVEEEEGEEEEL